MVFNISNVIWAKCVLENTYHSISTASQATFPLLQTASSRCRLSNSHFHCMALTSSHDHLSSLVRKTCRFLRCSVYCTVPSNKIYSDIAANLDK